LIHRFAPGTLANYIINHIETTMLPPKCIGVYNGQSCRNRATNGPRCAIHHKIWINTVSDLEIASSYDAFRMDVDC
jgi:hypothetical protein